MFHQFYYYCSHTFVLVSLQNLLKLQSTSLIVVSLLKTCTHQLSIVIHLILSRVWFRRHLVSEALVFLVVCCLTFNVLELRILTPTSTFSCRLVSDPASGAFLASEVFQSQVFLASRLPRLVFDSASEAFLASEVFHSQVLQITAGCDTASGAFLATEVFHISSSVLERCC